MKKMLISSLMILSLCIGFINISFSQFTSLEDANQKKSVAWEPLWTQEDRNNYEKELNRMANSEYCNTPTWNGWCPAGCEKQWNSCVAMDTKSINSSSLEEAVVSSSQVARKNLGIDMNTGCMMGIGCSFDIQKTLWLKEDTWQKERTSVLTFVQDVVLAATFFIGTIVTLAFIWAGVLFVVSGRNGDAGTRKKAQEGMINAAIGLVLVAGSYAIIRFIQFFASGG